MEAGAATENILLTAAGRRLASCWVGAFRDDEVASILGLLRHPFTVPPGGGVYSAEPLALIPVGHFPPPVRPDEGDGTAAAGDHHHDHHSY